MRNKIDKGLTMNLRFRFDQEMVAKERNLDREGSDVFKHKITRSSPSTLRMYKKLFKKHKMNLH